jgi:CspA family cold shock protein
MSKRVTGKVKWFSNDRGYGFCVADGDHEGIEYFVHYSSIKMDGYKTLRAKQAISFVLKDTDKGVQATEVEFI